MVLMRNALRLCFVCLLCVLAGGVLAAEGDQELRVEAEQTLRKAVGYFRERVARHNGYVYYYSLDLQQRWGEGKAAADTIFVQPPGTPTIGLAFLRAYDATGDRFYLEAARDSAEALAYGQLESGGWTQTIDFVPTANSGKYRNGRGGKRNNSSLDDGQTQSALLLCMQADQALEFKNEGIHEAALSGLQALLKAQFPNGAFPQVWTGPVESHPVRRASYPDYDWKVEGRIKNYWDQYTLNDGLAGTVSDTLIEAGRVYRDDKYRAALVRLGEFLLLAQMPQPQPAWCQQYNPEMKPIWARKFEPPAIASWESQDVMETLIKIARQTGDKKYLAPIPGAIAYLEKCVQPDGKLPRYLELQTNRPLYMNSKYELSYDGADAPSHYGWTQPSRLPRIARAYEAAARGDDVGKTRPAGGLADKVRKIIASLDDQGRWVSVYGGERLAGQPKFKTGERYLSSAVFAANVAALSEFLMKSDN